MTKTELITRALRKARNGEGPNETKLYEDNAELLIPNAMKRLAVKVAQDGNRRDYLMKTYSVAIAAGVGSLASATDLLQEGLPHARFYDADDAERNYPYVFKRNRHDLDRWLNPNWGYFALSNGAISTRQRGNGNITDSKVSTPGPATLIAPHIPDVAGAEFPEQLEDEAVDTLVELLLELRG